MRENDNTPASIGDVKRIVGESEPASISDVKKIVNDAEEVVKSVASDSDPVTVGQVKKMMATFCEKKCLVFTSWLDQLSSHAMSLEAVQTTCISMMEACTQAILEVHKLEKTINEFRLKINQKEFKDTYHMTDDT